MKCDGCGAWECVCGVPNLLQALKDSLRRSRRPDYCCGKCPAVKVNPEHPDCEACRTGVDCTCRFTPGCPNYDPKAVWTDGE